MPELQVGVDSHIIFFLFLHENICSRYSLEAPQRGASNVYLQHMFHDEVIKITVLFGKKKNPEKTLYLEL